MGELDTNHSPALILTQGQELQVPDSLDRGNAIQRSLSEALGQFTPLEEVDIRDAEAVFQMYTQELPSNLLPDLASQTAELAITRAEQLSFAEEVSPEQILEVLNSPELSSQIQAVELHSPPEGEENGLVLVWLRQAHADVGFGVNGQFVSGMSESAMDNQLASIDIGTALGAEGLRFIGLENTAQNLNNPTETEIQFADRVFSQEAVSEFSSALESQVRDETSGLEALQRVYPILDVQGLDRLRQPILQNHAFVDSQFPRYSSAVSDLRQVLPDDINGFREGVTQLLELEGGEAAVDALKAYLQIGFSFFSIASDEHGLDSVGGALLMQTDNMARGLNSREFLELQAAGPGPFATNVAAIQYGAIHTGIIDRGVGAGFQVIEVVPSGVNLEDANSQAALAVDFSEYAIERLAVINQLLESR